MPLWQRVHMWNVAHPMLYTIHRWCCWVVHSRKPVYQSRSGRLWWPSLILAEKKVQNLCPKKSIKAKMSSHMWNVAHPTLYTINRWCCWVVHSSKPVYQGRLWWPSLILAEKKVQNVHMWNVAHSMLHTIHRWCCWVVHSRTLVYQRRSGRLWWPSLILAETKVQNLCPQLKKNKLSRMSRKTLIVICILLRFW